MSVGEMANRHEIVALARGHQLRSTRSGDCKRLRLGLDGWIERSEWSRHRNQRDQA